VFAPANAASAVIAMAPGPGFPPAAAMSRLLRRSRPTSAPSSGRKPAGLTACTPRPLRRLQSRFGAGTNLAALGSEELSAWVEKSWRYRAPATYNRGIDVLRSAFSYWAGHGWTSGTPPWRVPCQNSLTAPELVFLRWLACPSLLADQAADDPPTLDPGGVVPLTTDTALELFQKGHRPPANRPPPGWCRLR
jgi:hypothetical protein